MQYSDRGMSFVLPQITLHNDVCHFTRNVTAIF
jgi:hypothetical protein